MGAKVAGVALFFIVGLMLADLLAHPKGTQILTSSAVQAEKAGTNALLGVASK